MKKKCSIYGSGHVYHNEGGNVHWCKCGKRIMFDPSDKTWYTEVNGAWVKDDQQ